MQHGHVIVSAVLRTLLRATVDERTPVVLRTRRPEQAHQLSRWLEQVHGSRREVVASTTLRGEIIVKLPVGLVLPPLAGVAVDDRRPLASRRPGAQLSPQLAPSSPTGFR